VTHETCDSLATLPSNFAKSSDIYSTKYDNFKDIFYFLSSQLVQNNRDRKRKKDNKNIMQVWERKLSKKL